MIYVMSDLHGNYDMFIEMLKKINFNKKDTLYILGDIIDRGLNPVEIYDYIIANPNIILLMGNHEKMMLDFANLNNNDIKYDNSVYYTREMRNKYDIWMRNGGLNTYNKISSLDNDKRIEMIKYFSSLPYYVLLNINDKKFILCHARPIFYDLPYNNNPTVEEMLDTLIDNDEILWCRDNLPQEIPNNYIVIHGHSPVQRSFNANKITYYSNNKIIDIDCGCAFYGKLGCLRLDDMKEFYVTKESD